MILFSYICLFLMVISLFIIGIIYFDRSLKNRMFNKIKDFDKYIIVLEYHMSRAYEIIYKDKILIYSLEGMKVDDKEFNAASKDYAMLVLKLMGPNLKDEFIELYGNEETLMFNVVEYFNTKFETDEIREKSKQNFFTDTEDSLVKKEDITNYGKFR
jgi:hypothetical protein